jgi:glycyl-tRNA synthetase (class II)
VTIRDRNTAQQTRVALDKVKDFLELNLFRN